MKSEIIYYNKNCTISWQLNVDKYLIFQESRKRDTFDNEKNYLAL